MTAPADMAAGERGLASAWAAIGRSPPDRRDDA